MALCQRPTSSGPLEKQSNRNFHSVPFNENIEVCIESWDISYVIFSIWIGPSFDTLTGLNCFGGSNIYLTLSNGLGSTGLRSV